MNKITIVLLLIFLSSFVMGQHPSELINFRSIEDINFDVFSDSEYEYRSFYNKTYDTEDFANNFFLPWNYIKETDSKVVELIWNEYFSYDKGIAAKGGGCYTGNYQKYTDDLLEEINNNIPQNRETFLDVVDYGITISSTNIRRLPTDEFCLKRIRNAGEGYPFDELQYTSIWIGTPIVILEKSNDNIWYFVQSTYSKGWVKAESIALTDKSQREFIINSPKKVIVSDGVIINTKSTPIRLKLGTLLPSLPNSNELLIPAKSYSGSKLFFDTVRINSVGIKEFPIEFNEDNVKLVLSELIEGKYSWGGIDGGRDCSSTLKDYFTLFGIWIPRNSWAQSMSGDTTNLEVLKNDSLKLEKIAEKGLPFLSTIYMTGHIVLYLGKKEKFSPLIFHQVWGVKAFYSDKNLLEISDYRDEFSVFGIHERDFWADEVQTRFIIGRTVITSIEPTEVFDEIDKFRVKPFVKNYLRLTNIAKK